MKGKKMGKSLASGGLNFSEYAVAEHTNNKMTLELSSAADSVDRALLRITISCEAIANSDDKCAGSFLLCVCVLMMSGDLQPE